MDRIVARFEADRSANTLAPAKAIEYMSLVVHAMGGTVPSSSIDPAAPRRARNPTVTLPSGQSALLIREEDVMLYTVTGRLPSPFTELILQIDGRPLARCMYAANPYYGGVSMMVRSLQEFHDAL